MPGSVKTRDDMKLFSIPHPVGLARALLSGRGFTRGIAEWKRFTDGEASVNVGAVSGRVAALGRLTPGTDDIFLTALLIDALRRNGAARVTVIVPYLAYERQDRRAAPGEPVSAAVVTRLLAAAGASRIMTADLHSRADAAVSMIPIANVPVLTSMAAPLARLLRGRQVTVVSPDRGGLARASAFAKALGAGRPIWIEKERLPSGAKARRLRGKPLPGPVVLVDDIVDTGGTVFEAVRLLKKAGARELYLCATHPILSGPAVKRLRSCGFRRIFFSDTVPLTRAARNLPITVITAAEAFKKACL